ncbi:HNH endonuclease signature motif containing protein [Blastococcus litoris]|uniref:HNH endonuclease signature motif containing protein n=1 Tax=Blastococcus litoris TaxID=2171622 RepID=UPI000E300E98|nr:HNH endonuclease signature motif containing protein [Blastococcus litoris]
MTERCTGSGEDPGAPTVGWASGPLGAVQRADRVIGRSTAARARAVAAFAAERPASVDRPAGQRGAMGAARRSARPQVLADVSEWAAPELVVALSISQRAAEQLLERSLTLVHRLPRTLVALERGAVNTGHVWPLLEHVAPIADDGLRAEVEAELLAWVADRSVTTGAQLGAKARRVVLARDVRAAARRLTAALRGRGVTCRPGTTEGTAVVSALLTVPEAQAVMDALGRYVDAVDDDPEDTRTREAKMADCLLDLVLRPGETGLPPVQAQVTLVASLSTMAGGDEPGEIGGEPVPAEMVRALARALGLIPDVAEPGATMPEVTEPEDTEPEDTEPGDTEPEDTEPEGTEHGSGRPWEGEDPTGEQRALEDWWAATERRVLAEGWRGAEAPPPAEQERWWAEQARLDAMPTAADLWDPGESPRAAVLDPAPVPIAVGTGTSSWAAADSAVDTAGLALLDLDRALGRARTAVARAERADALDEEAWQGSPGGRLSGAADSLEALAAMSSEQREALADLLTRTSGGGLVDRPRVAVRNAVTGALLALTDLPGLRRAARSSRGLGPPPDTPGYRPGARLDRFLRARDRRCRFPGCRAPVPRGGELDHDRPYPDGATSATNLAGYCTSHHRGKHQAPGLRHELARDGTLTVTTASGLVAVTTPPPF